MYQKANRFQAQIVRVKQVIFIHTVNERQDSAEKTTQSFKHTDTHPVYESVCESVLLVQAALTPTDVRRVKTQISDIREFRKTDGRGTIFAA